MLKWLHERFGPKRMHDPIFGSLVYMDGYWEGAGRFDPAGRQIEWFVEAGIEGPAESQRALLASTASKYQELLPAVLSVVCPHASEWAQTTFGAPELDPMLTLTAIDLPAEESSQMTWALYFESQLRGNPHFVVQMRGWEPTGEVEVSD